MTTIPILDPALLQVVDAYRTCEFATLSRAGVPITWPAVTVRRDDGTFLLTTSIALPQKAFNIRRDPRVALLFSNPTGSGLPDAPQLLVQGAAECPDEIVTGALGDADYWRRLAVRQPSSRSQRSNPLSRWLFDWYFMRLRITVTPTAVHSRPALPEPPASTGYPTMVLGTGDPTGQPDLRRVRVRAGEGAGVLALDVPDADAVAPGPASLLGHGHDEQLSNLRGTLRLGELVHRADGWAFATSRTVGQPGTDAGPLATLRALRDLRRRADRYLTHRGLARPAIAWDEFAAVDRSAASR